MNSRHTAESTESIMEAVADQVGVPRALPTWLRVVHLGIILNFVAQCAYICWQVFVVLEPPGAIGPIFGHATELPYNIMVARRMYAQEGWMAFIGLSLYLGVTEILPRRRKH